MKTYKIMFSKTFFKKDGKKMLVDKEKSYKKEVTSFNDIKKAKDFLQNYELKENESISFLKKIDNNNYKIYHKTTNEDGIIILKNI